jgi:anaerobic carbon-monoxide dehydrogenase iron sulfur subunit
LKEDGMYGKVLVIDHEKCTGCRQCEMVCSVFHTGSSNPSRSRIKVMKWENIGFYLPMSCQNCEKPFCTEVCPTKACHRDADHQRVVIDKDKCIGCKTCIIACPFGHPFFDIHERVTVKCDYCDGTPQCVVFCSVKAVDYVDADRIQMAKKKEVFTRFTGAMKRGE